MDVGVNAALNGQVTHVVSEDGCRADIKIIVRGISELKLDVRRSGSNPPVCVNAKRRAVRINDCVRLVGYQAGASLPTFGRVVDCIRLNLVINFDILVRNSGDKTGNAKCRDKSL